MALKKAMMERAHSKVRYDTSPGNAHGWRPVSDWGIEENQHCVALIASLVLEHRKELYRDDKFKPWAFNGGNLVNIKIKQILTKLCKEHGVELPEVQVGKCSKKRSAQEEKEEAPHFARKKSKVAAPSLHRAAVREED